ncbi:hypothetical protein BH09PLA1_BH09PLA1_25500 [soil metagenome]
MQKYFFANGHEQRGPYSLDELASFGLRPDTLVWHEGLSEWQRADSLAELSAKMDELQHAAASAAPVSVAPQGAGFAPPQAHAQLNYQTNMPVVTDGLAIASLVLSLVSYPLMCLYLTGMLPAILAIVFGFISRARIRRGERTGAGMALAGLILGFISAGTIIVLFLVFFVIGLIAAMK